MYRIELNDEIGVYRSIEEIAAAIRSGTVTRRSRIYHQASDKWLPIEFHPHCKQAFELAESAPAPPAVTATPADLPESVPSALAPARRAPVEASVAPAAPRAAVEPSVASAAHRPSVEPSAAPVAQRPPVEPSAAPLPPLAAQFPGPATPDPEPEPEIRSEPLPELKDVPVVWIEPGPVQRSDSSKWIRRRLHIDVAVRRPRRPFVLAASAVLVVVSTHLALSAALPAIRFDLGVPRVSLPRITLPEVRLPSVSVPAITVPHLDLPDVPLPGRLRDSVPVPAPNTKRTVPPAAGPAKTAMVPPRRPARTEPEPQGSPSFGVSSAFAPTRSYGRAAMGATAPLRDPADEVVPAPDQITVAAPIAAADKAVKVSAAVLISRYQAAYGSARAELETGFRTAGFADLFAASRLANPESVRAARLATATASAYVGKYRRREVEIERVYADSFATLARLHGWSSAERRVWEARRVERENADVVKLAGQLLQSIDSLYGILTEQDGAYSISGGTITFRSPKAARAYLELRPWLDRRTHAPAESASPPTTAGRILRAMGPTQPPTAS